MASLSISKSVQALTKHYASEKINRDIGEQVPFVNLVKSAKTFAKSPEYEANPQYSLSRKKLCLNII